jgi:hypothetical protein
VRRVVGLGLALIAAGGPVDAAAPAAAELPRLTVNTAMPATERTIAVPAGGNLQEALDRAQPGDALVLEAGATYVGPFTLPKKSGNGWIVIRTNAPDGRLPAPGRRVNPSHAPLMPKLVSATEPVVAAAPGAHHYRLIGLEIHPQPGVFLRNLVTLGSRMRTLEDLPHRIVIDRCYLHGDPGEGARRGVALNSRHTAVVDSYLSDFKEVGADSQAIAGWSGSGPFKIANNYLEAAGENVMFGGGDPPIADLVPADIEIRGNHMAKPLGWRAGGPTQRAWTVKNLFELKNARRVLIDGNLFERNWVQAQSGFAILFTVRNQDGGAPWSVIEDVTFVNNVVRQAPAGIYVLGRDDAHPSQPARRLVIRNNVFEEVGGPRWGGGGALFQLIGGPADVTIEHNTAFQAGSIIVAEGLPVRRFAFRANIVPHNAYGIVGTGTAPGAPTIERYFPDARIEGNIIAGPGTTAYPGKNFFPASLDAVGFADRTSGDYRLTDGSRYRGAGDRAPGADLDGVTGARAAGEPSASPR